MKHKPAKSRAASARGPEAQGAPATRPPAAASKSPLPVVSSFRRRWFRLLALCSPLLLLVLLEAGLRLAGYGHPTSFFLRATQDGEAVLIENYRFGWRFFPPSLARSPQPVRLAAKPPGAIRVFVLGESAAMGDPEPAYGVARHLERLLQARHPERPIEVVNVAMTAINSHVIRDISRDCAKASGDLWIIYAGNNEVVGPFGAGTIFGKQAPGLLAVRLNLALKRTRLGQMLASLGRAKNEPAEWQGMELFLEQQVGRDDPRLARVYANFAGNLEAIVRLGLGSGTRVLLASMPVNLKDCPPFASGHRPGLSSAQKEEWDKHFAAAQEAERQSRFEEALAAYDQAARIDSEYAELSFRRAICKLALGQTNAAQTDFALARDLDTLRFRADSRLNGIVRQVAQATGIRLIDAEAESAKRSAGEVPGDDLFLDHVHLNFTGNYWLARLLLPEVERELFGAPSSAQPTSGATSHAPLEEAEVARRVAFTPFDQRRVFEEMRQRLRQPPFSTQSNFKERDAAWEEQLALLPTAPQVALSNYVEAVAQAPQDWQLRANYARVLEAADDVPGATAQWEQVARLLPHEPEAFFQLGNLAQDKGAYADAERLFRESLQRQPRSTEAINGLGLVARARGQTAEAEQQFRAALAVNPRFAAARVNLAVLFADKGNVAAAKEQYNLALRADTNNAAARINLARLLADEGKIQEAISLYSQAVTLQPDNAIAHYNLANALSTQKKYAEALTHYRAAVKADPNFAEARYNLAMELARLGRVAEAMDHFAEAVRLQPGVAEAHFNYGVALAKQKRFSEAAREFQETLRLQPQHPSAASLLERARMLSETSAPEQAN